MKCLWERGFTLRAGSICPRHQFGATSHCWDRMAQAPGDTKWHQFTAFHDQLKKLFTPGPTQGTVQQSPYQETCFPNGPWWRKKNPRVIPNSIWWRRRCGEVCVMGESGFIERAGTICPHYQFADTGLWWHQMAPDPGDMYLGPHFIFVTTITTAGCVKNSVKCKIFQWIRERNWFNIAQNV